MSTFEHNFNELTKAEWEQLVRKQLGLESLNQLNWEPEPNLEIPPYLTAAEVESIKYVDKFARQTPGWQNLQFIDASSAEQAKKAIKEALVHKINGVILWSIADDDLIEIIDEFKDENLAIYNRNTLDPETLDQPDNLTLDLGLSFFDQSDVEEILAQQYSVSKLFKISSLEMHVEGVDPINEVAIIVAQFAEYLHEMKQIGNDVAVALNLVTFDIAIGNKFYLEIAKIKAIRILIYQICAGYQANIDHNDIHILGINSKRYFSEVDLDTNILRGTTAAISAIFGGANAVCIRPHTSPSNAFSQRIARNISNILKHEAHMDKVTNPIEGAYFINYITDQLAQKAWIKFQEIEQAGGFIKWADSGHLYSLTSNSKSAFQHKVQSQEQVIIGENKYKK